MVKTLYHYGPSAPTGGPYPPPPPLPKYDPSQEALKWDWYRIIWHFPKFEKHPDLPQRRGGLPESDDKPDWRGVIKNNVIPLPKVEPYKYGRPQDPNYWFFDTPDYADPFKKLWYSFKWFTHSGAIIAAFFGIITGKTTKFKDLKYMATRYTLPWLCGGMVFSTAAITLANLRGNKDDLYNYFIAGLVTGAATGHKNYLVHIRHTFFWCSAGMLVKYKAETNGDLSLYASPRAQHWGLAGQSAEGGLLTGNLQFYKCHPEGDPGRDTKTYAM